MSAGLLGKEVSWSMTASAPDLRIASSTAAASSASTSATSAPSSFRPCVLALERVIPVTAWPWRTSSATSGRPMAPVAPATKTFMVVLLSVLLLFRSPCQSEFSRVSVVEERHVLLDGLALDVQAIGGEVRVGVADRQPAQDRQFRGDSELRADNLGVPRDRDLDAGAQATCGEGQQQRLQEHPDAEGVRRSEVPVHADNAGQRRAEELPVAHDGSVMAGLVLTGNSHRPVDFSAQFLAKVPERLGQRRDVGWPTVRRLE